MKILQLETTLELSIEFQFGFCKCLKYYQVLQVDEHVCIPDAEDSIILVKSILLLYAPV